MKRVYIATCMFVLILLASCSNVTETSSYQPKEDYDTFISEYNDIANEISILLLENGENISISPSSILNVIAIIYETTTIQNQEKISKHFSVPKEKLGSYFCQLFNSLKKVYYSDELKYNNDGSVYREKIGGLDISNSFWYNETKNVESKNASKLIDEYNLHINKVKFGKETDKKISEYIKETTDGLIDLSDQLYFPEQTLYSLINVQYLMDRWGTKDLIYSQDKYSFTNSNGTKKDINLLIGKYIDGVAIEKEQYKYFYTETANGYKLKFIVPKEKYSIDDIMKKEVLTEVSNINKFNDTESENHATRCLFPAFETGYSKDILNVLNDYFDGLFSDKDLLSGLIKNDITSAEQLLHATKVNVDEKGIRAAAATLVSNYGSAGSQKTYHDFMVDRSFMYIITDSNDIELFVGTVDNMVN